MSNFEKVEGSFCKKVILLDNALNTKKIIQMLFVKMQLMNVIYVIFIVKIKLIMISIY